MGKKIDLGNIDDSQNNLDNTSPIRASFLKNETFSKSKSSKSKDNNDYDDFDPSYININLGKEEKGPINNFQKLKDKSLKKKRKWKKYILLFFLLLIIGIGTFAGVKAFQAFSDLKKGGVDVSIGDILGNVIPGKKDGPELLKDGDLTNALFVGVDTRSSGADSGLENTDSIMIASLNHKTNKLSLISIPRDNNVIFHVGKDNKTSISNYRINASYAVADQYKFPGGGLSLMRQTLTEMTGLQIHYTAQVNFNAFKQIIDKLGGITVNVDNAFTDYEYPNDNDTGVITVSFKKGEQTMTGAKALQYARSRHSGDNGEGSDYSRARRQQKVLVAVQEKLKTTNFVTDPNAATDFIKIFGDNVKIQKTSNSTATAENINFKDLSAALALKDKVNTKNVASVVLDPTIGGLNNILVRLDSEAYMIGPKLGTGKYDDLKRYVSFVINTPDLYLENRPGLDAENNKQYAEIGFVDNGFGYSNTLGEANKLDKDFISSTYMAQLKAAISLSPVTTGTATPDPSNILTGAGIYDVSQKKSATKDYLIKRYNAKVLTAAQIPDSIKKLDKDYDLILFFTK